MKNEIFILRRIDGGATTVRIFQDRETALAAHQELVKVYPQYQYRVVKWQFDPGTDEYEPISMVTT